MENKILGLHHITAIAGNAQKNVDFYTKVLGLRLVKKTVNFDDPGTYHFYYGDESGNPGTILTFFPWEGIAKGRTGTGMATEINFAVPENSLKYWEDRLTENKVVFNRSAPRLGDVSLKLQDPDGLILNFIETKDSRQPWKAVPEEYGVKGFQGAVLTLNKLEPTAKLLTDTLGYELDKQEGNLYRFITRAAENANVIDILLDPDGRRGHNAAGTNHHIAFRVKDDNVLMNFREKIAALGYNITPKIDRNYFYSLYFREPGGVLFEIATDNPGFAIDEPKDKLGKELKLPAQYENARKEIEKLLPVVEF